MITRRGIHMGLGVMMVAALLPAAARAGTVKRLPITLSPDGKPLIQVTIEGKGPYTFLIDTGATMSSVTDSVAKTLRLDFLPSRAKLKSIKGDNFSSIYRAKDIVMGGSIRMPDWEMAGLDQPPMDGVDGLLPASLLTAMPTQLDYEAGELRYYMGGAAMDLSGFTKLDAYFHAEPGSFEQVFVQVHLGGDKMVCCMDTGAGGPLYLYSDTVRTRKLWDKYQILQETSNTGTNGRVIKGRAVLAQAVDIGGIAFGQLPLVLGDPADILANSGDYDQGLLGAGFLSGFTVAFGGDKTVYLKRNGRALPALAGLKAG